MTTDEARSRLYDTTFLIGAYRRRSAIKALANASDASGVVALAQALHEGHPERARIGRVLQRLSLLTDGHKIAALWSQWAQAPDTELASVLSALGWPPEQAQEARLVRAVMAAATATTTATILHAVAVFARALPLQDEAANDAIYTAWIRSQSTELEQLIAEQSRQASSPALEALHALVTGQQEHYLELNDADGMLLVHAFNMAPEPFRQSIASIVGSSTDRSLLENYRRALSSISADPASKVENLKLVGDEDGLFEVTRSLRLFEVIDLLERWSGSAGRPSGNQQRAAVERALAAYRTLVNFKVEQSEPLPAGLVDILEWWRHEQPSNEQLRADLGAADPLRIARGLYMGREAGLVSDARLHEAASSEHWPQRLVARLLEPELFNTAVPDHVHWVNVCAGDATLLLSPINGTPQDFARYRTLLSRAGYPVGSRTRALLEILSAFQSVFVASAIVIDETARLPDSRAVEIEDAPHDFPG